MCKRKAQQITMLARHRDWLRLWDMALELRLYNVCTCPCTMHFNTCSSNRVFFAKSIIIREQQDNVLLQDDNTVYCQKIRHL